MIKFKEIILYAIFFIIGAMMSHVFTTKRNKRDLKEIERTIEEYGQGNVLYRINTGKRNDNYKSMTYAFEHLHTMLKNWVFEFIRSSTVITASSSMVKEDAHNCMETINSLSHNVQSFAAGAQGVNSEILNFTALSQQLSVSITEVANISEKMNDKANDTRKTVFNGTQAIEGAMKTIEEISHSLESSGYEIKRLNELMAEVQGIAGKINGIADQINLLSLNAAIETARSGEHGRGFAVVADEVRKLAEQSAVATQEIAAILQSLHNESRNAVKQIKEGELSVSKGQEFATTTVASIVKAKEDMEGFLKAVEIVLFNMNQVKRRSGEVADEMSTITQITEKSMGSLEELFATAEVQHTEVNRITSEISRLNELSMQLQTSQK